MKRILLFLFMAVTLTANSQSKDLSTVNTVKPARGQKMAFETNYKAHVAKFHKDDQKTSVYEIMSGEMAGYYHLVNSGRSYADFDKERPDAAAHNADLDKTFFPLLQDTRNGTFHYLDSLSLHPDVVADKFLVTVRHINPTMEADYRTEQANSVKVLKNVKGKFWDNLSFSYYDKLWDGTDPVIVSIRALKDGFQSLDTDFYGPAGSGFRDEYVKMYGTAAWDKRTKLMQDAIVKNEQYIMRLRKDLSSQ